MVSAQIFMTMTNTEMRLKDNRLISGSSQEKKIIGWSLALAGFLVFLDQLTKVMTIHHFGSPENHRPISVIPDFFNLVYVHNNGAAWNMLAGQTWILLVISVVVLLFIVVKLRSITEGWAERFIALFMVVSGIVGNTADRMWNNGNVIDFLDFTLRIGSWSYRWPAFNVADSAICVGATIFIISSFIRPTEDSDSVQAK